MTGSPRDRSFLPALVLLLVAELLLPMAVVAHAELTGSDPAHGASVTGPLAGPIVLTYSEALQPGSHAELLDPGGTRLADATIDAANRARMLLNPAVPLQPARYTVQWTSVAADKDVARGQVTFTVVAPTPVPPTPTPLPATAVPTAAPTTVPTPPPSASASVAAPAITPTPTPVAAASATDAIVPIIAALALVAIVGVMLMRRGRGVP